MMKNEKKFARIMPATRILQAVVGTGEFKSEHVDKAQAAISRVKGRLDLSEFAQAHLEEMSGAIDAIRDKSMSDEDIIKTCTHSIVNYKSAVGLFGDDTCLPLCTIVFQFLDSVHEVEEDFSDLIGIYFTVMTKILVDKAFNEDEIKLVTKEIKASCDRYYARHPDVEPSKIIDNVDLTFGDIQELDDD